MPLSAISVSATMLRKAALATLIAANTDAGQSVYDADFTPSPISDLPEIYLSTPSIRKDVTGQGTPKFWATVALVAVARVEDADERQAEAALSRIAEQAEAAILSSPAMNDLVRSFTYVEAHSVVSGSGGGFAGEASIIFGCQVWQEYWPDAGTPLTGFHTTVPASAQGAPTTFDTPRPPSP